MQQIRAEVTRAFTADDLTGKQKLDVSKLLSLPRLNSVYTEVLRMRVSFNMTREVQRDIQIDGYKVSKGSLVQSASQIAHYDESVWGAEKHPAAEFWADRHLESVDRNCVSEVAFSVKARPASLFPFGTCQPTYTLPANTTNQFLAGGGYAVCPGRHFAKREILMAVAIVVAKFDLQFVEWVNTDGSPSDRPAISDPRYAGAGTMPPDRDMKVRWRRQW